MNANIYITGYGVTCPHCGHLHLLRGHNEKKIKYTLKCHACHRSMDISIVCRMRKHKAATKPVKSIETLGFTF